MISKNKIYSRVEKLSKIWVENWRKESIFSLFTRLVVIVSEKNLYKWIGINLRWKLSSERDVHLSVDSIFNLPRIDTSTETICISFSFDKGEDRTGQSQSQNQKVDHLSLLLYPTIPFTLLRSQLYPTDWVGWFGLESRTDADNDLPSQRKK